MMERSPSSISPSSSVFHSNAEKEDCYVFQLKENLISNCLVSSGSDLQLNVFDLENFQSVRKCPHSLKINDFCFLDPNNLVSCSGNCVYLWDLRVQEPTASFGLSDDGQLEHNTQQTGKELLCCSFSNSNFAVGIEGGELLVWRGRELASQQKYEHHTDDVTCLTFHPFQKDLLWSASTDGLICCTDISKLPESAEATTSSEHYDDDGCLIKVLNTEVSVSKIGLFGENYGQLYSFSTLEDFSLWLLNDQERKEYHQLNSFNGSEYMVDFIYDQISKSASLFTGNYKGDLSIFEGGKKKGTFSGAHTGTIRSLFWLPLEKKLFTGAEDGKIVLWNTSDLASTPGKILPSKLLKKTIKRGPY